MQEWIPSAPVNNLRSALARTEGVQIVELAIVLPLLMVLLVGIFDFGNAFNLRQKLTNIARSAARFGASSSTADLNSGGTPPPSVAAIRNFVDDSLQANGLNDCNLNRVGGTQTGGQLLWTFTAAGNGCVAPGVTLVVDRSCCSGSGTASCPTQPLTATVQGVTMYVISTHICLSYSYKWTFDNVISLIAPGSVYPGVSQIQSVAFVPNLD